MPALLTIDVSGQEAVAIEVEEVRRRLVDSTLDRNVRVLVSRPTGPNPDQPVVDHPAGVSDKATEDRQPSTSPGLESSVGVPLKDFAKRHYRIDVLYEPVMAHARQGSRIGGWILGAFGGVFGIAGPCGDLLQNEPMPSSVWGWLALIVVLIIALSMTLAVVTTNVKARRVLVVGSLGGYLTIAFLLTAVGYFMIGPYGFVGMLPMTVAIGISVFGLIGCGIGWGLGLVVGIIRRPWLPRPRAVV